MKIKYLRVINEEEKYLYNFSDNITLIHSDENSKGKTTLIRFILYAMGYQIPATEGIGSFDKMKFELCFSNNNLEYYLFRNADEMKLVFDKNTNMYVLPMQENELHSFIFSIDEISVIKNLLSVYYIDQEKGWTMLNRGKIIGNIRFNIEEFIAGVSNININSLIEEKATISNELKKYRYFKNVIDIDSEYDDADTILNDARKPLEDLLQEQKRLELDLAQIKQKRKSVSEIILGNKKFSNLLIDLGIVVIHNNEEFVLSEKNLAKFDSNQEVLKMKEKMFRIDEEKIVEDLQRITRVINEKNNLFSLDSIVQELEKIVEKSSIDVNKIDKVISQLNNKRKSVNEKIKNKLSFNNTQLYDFYDNINKYAIELGIKQYISNDSPNFVLTNKLKGFSGRVLAQMSYIFKLSYVKIIDKNYHVKLPLIIDSPRTNELSQDSTDNMLRILKRDFSEHQVIIASIYKYDVISYDEINLNDGLFDKKFREY